MSRRKKKDKRKEENTVLTQNLKILTKLLVS